MITVDLNGNVLSVDADGNTKPVTTITPNDVISRLEMLGYVVKSEDMKAINYELNKAVAYALNYCNIEYVPTIVNYKIIDVVASWFLYFKKNSGQLEGFNYDAVIRQIKEGDTTLTYGTYASSGETEETRFDKFVKQLKQTLDKWLTPYRRLRW